jgi:hypothetical protein
MLADILGPLAEAGADLQVVMANRYPDGTETADIELHPVSGRKPVVAAKTAGLAQSPIPTLPPSRGSLFPYQSEHYKPGQHGR